MSSRHKSLVCTIALSAIMLMAACTDGPKLSETTPTPGASPTAASLPTVSVEVRWDVYHPDPAHIWNRLFRQFYGRTTEDGTEYGWDSLDPLLWYETTYLLEGPSHQQAIQLLDEFLSTDGEALLTDPLKRAMFQRDLWAVFDWLAWRTHNDLDQRRALQARLAQVIQRLALTTTEIQSLPDNYAVAVNSGAFPANFQSDNLGNAFLPPNLFRPDGEWVNLGREGGPIAMTHTAELPFFGRSVFLVFIRVPGGREETLGFLNQLKQQQALAIPAGTEVALERRMLLINEKGNLTLSPLVESVQIRHFSSNTVQIPFEFALRRDWLFAGVAGGLRPLAVSDKDFPLFRSHGIDWFEAEMEGAGDGRAVMLSSCASCHEDRGMGITGVRSILSYSRERFPLPDNERLTLIETTPELEAQAVIAWKLKQDSWHALRALWDEVP